jgi:hypothetical protein
MYALRDRCFREKSKTLFMFLILKNQNRDADTFDIARFAFGMLHIGNPGACGSKPSGNTVSCRRTFSVAVGAQNRSHASTDALFSPGSPHCLQRDSPDGAAHRYDPWVRESFMVDA